jgi:N-acetylglucosamine-6-phosphate deacetylase
MPSTAAEDGGGRAIRVGRLLLGDAFVDDATLILRDGVILDVRSGGEPPGSGPGQRAERLDDGFVTAGMVDLQINGCYGVDFASASPADWVTVSQRLLSTGVTSYVPTFVTAPIQALGRCLDRTYAAMQAPLAAEPGPVAARILGAHLEGPFISPERAGAHDPAYMIDPDSAALDVLLSTRERQAALRVLTLSPERAGAADAIRLLVDSGVLVALGHSDDDGTAAHRAVDAGARMVTHLFNAMRPLDHRGPSLIAAALREPRLSLGIIADLHHVHPDVLATVLRVAPERTVLVTDAVAAAGLPPGRYELGGAAVTTSEADPLPRRDDGVLAGSVLRLDRAVRNVVGLGLPLTDALLAATRNPAAALGLDALGRIAPGAAADLVWWSEDLTVRRVWVGGVEVRPT